MKRLITTICLMAATTMVVAVEESEASSRGHRAHSGAIQRGHRVRPIRQVASPSRRPMATKPSRPVARPTMNLLSRGPITSTSRPRSTPGRAIGPLPRPQPNRPWFNPKRRDRFVNHWCFRRPMYCHWWFDYCLLLAYCQPLDCTPRDFVQVGITQVVLPGGEIINDGVWYLGLKGMILPETGLGTD